MTNKIYQYLLKIDYVPFIVSTSIFFILLLLMPNWIYNPIGKQDSDTWLYTGYLFNYKLMYKLYPNSHVTDAVSINLIGNFFYQIFPVFFANLTLKLTKFILFGYFLYNIVKIKINPRTALWTLIASCFYFGTIVAFSSDYSDGWLAMYITASIFFLLKSDYCFKYINILISGFIFAVAVGASAQALAYIPSMILMIFFNDFFNKIEIRKIIYKIFIFSLGLLAGIAFIYLIYFFITGHFSLFFNSINRAEIFLNFGRWFGPFNIHLKNNLLFTIILLLCSIFIYLKQKTNENNFNTVVFISVMSNIIVLSYMEFINKQETLSCLVYFNAILPFILILFAINIDYFLNLTKLNKKDYIFLTVMLLLSCVIFYMPVYKPVVEKARMIVMSFENPMPLLYPIVKIQFLIIFAIFFLTGIFLTKNKYLKIYIFFIFIILLNFTIWNDWIRNDKYSDKFTGKNMFLASKQWFDYINKSDPKRLKHGFMFNESEDTIIKNFICVSNLKFPLVGRAMPSIDADVDLSTLSNTIILGTNLNKINEAFANFEKNGRKIDYKVQREFINGNIKFYVITVYFYDK